ncbi:hypothetical protein [Photorhabdus khanii]|uniref:hypothetical protein n=1 Tax=Photorhabdus khanii TaxID=1004150 RepID=UPI0018656624|nr:hypothetical protein [Photorhabdus khanii]
MKKWYLLNYKPREYRNIVKYVTQLKIEYFMPMTAVLRPRADSLVSLHKQDL